MASPYIGEIRLFAGNFAPISHAFCGGGLLAISQNSALFNLIGTTFGGDGQNTFGLPDLRGRLPIHQGTGPGLSSYILGEILGTESVTLLANQMPAHTHQAQVTNAAATSPTPGGGMLPATLAAPWTGYWVASGNTTGSPIPISPQAIGTRGGSQPHTNIMPVTAISMVIALFGVFPSQN